MKLVYYRFLSVKFLLCLFLVLQILLWYKIKSYKPDFIIVPKAPSTTAVKALSLGDEQFYFRHYTFILQNAGDTFGRFTALKYYDYKELYNWFKLLDSLDSKSNFVPALAGYYFSQTQNTQDVIYVIKYLDEHASADMYNKWWWMGQAVYLANNKLKDKKLALELAYKLAATPRDDIPLWTKQMPAFIHEKMGEEQQALLIIKNIMDNVENIDQGEINFMRYFVEERLNQIINNYPELQKLLKGEYNSSKNASK